MLIYVITSFISAVLLFQVEPLIGKSLLPWFGGSPSVWTTCLMFFQAIMLGGYAYAHLAATKLGPRAQVVVHLAVLTAGLAFARVLPTDDWRPMGQESPLVHLLVVLIVHVGVPFFALSATAPLLQSWFFAKHPGRSPYPLYAVSNAGSLLALIGYPLVMEPLWPLRSQETIWFVGYLVFFAGCAFCSISNWRGDARAFSVVSKDEAQEKTGPHSAGSWWKWVGLSALGSMLLVSTSAQISQDIAALPLFWVVPLGIYLLSFILCFARDELYNSRVWLTVLPLAVLGVAAQLLFGGLMPVTIQLAIYAATLFIGCMVCHGELAHRRPAASRLTSYYLAVSVGGVVGGAFVAVVAPFLFPGMWEYSLGWLGLYTLVLVLLGQEESLSFHLKRFSLIRVLLGAGWLVAAICFSADLVVDQRGAVVTSRGFFGRLSVSRKRDRQCLWSGSIQHGCQWLDVELAFEPTTYFGTESGVGVAVETMRGRDAAGQSRPLRIGVVGLGVGTCAAWGEEGDTVRFYEIDPEVVRLARTHFTYLRDASAEVEIVVGDARLTLEQEVTTGREPLLDLLVLDAFSSDAIPLHLLTREAFAAYWKRIKPGGILAAHISNQHIDFEPLLLGLSAEAGREALLVHAEDDPESMSYRCTWVLVTGNADLAKSIRSGGHADPWPEEYSEPVVFTDQHSNLLRLL
ncbi:MAG: ferrichrome ABC transporter permease [Deltaproteobacteria bacterium]|nr:ferrichrome ABC transporter permease [Deltaproteobacteria bacterium]